MCKKEENLNMVLGLCIVMILLGIVVIFVLLLFLSFGN